MNPSAREPPSPQRAKKAARSALRSWTVIRYPSPARRQPFGTPDILSRFPGVLPAMKRTELSAIVLELLKKETGESYPIFDDSTSLREGLNLDSIDMAGLIIHIESRFEIQIETALLDGINTVGTMLDMLQAKIDAKAIRQAA
ncbi:MAG: acyl carrier protein [Planctomycetota bacterium]|jgi:acyl carrier protein|nr:MAG: acyl carrier protein [Planctomycetota bacterium]